MKIVCDFSVFYLDRTLPKGTVLIECGKMLERGRPYKDEKGNLSYQPYRIKVFNTIDFGKSMHYNPFAYISKKNREKDILKFVDVLIRNTQSSQQNGGDDFWVSATRSQTVKSLRTSNGFPLFGELVV